MKVYSFDLTGSAKTSGELYPYLSEDRKSYCDEFGNEKVRLRSVWGYILLRYALIREYGIYERPVFEHTGHGKPWLKDFPGIFFSISHSDSRVICAVSDNELGADIQDARPVSTNAARKFCTPGELETILAIPDEKERYTALSRLWCIKESAGKKTGLGFSEGFSHIDAGELVKSGSAAVIFDEDHFISVCAGDITDGITLQKLCEKEIFSVIGQKPCVIFGAGEEFSQRIGLPEGECFTVAADGGLDRMLPVKLSPDRIIGDFDSLGRTPPGDDVIKLPCKKDRTDMDEAVLLGLSEGCTEFHIYGGTGGRLDHTLANIQLAARLAGDGKKCVIHGGGYDITAVSPLVPLYLKAGSGFRGGYISVFAVSDRCSGVNIKGLEYELDNGTLTNTFALGVSNSFTGKDAFISVSDGIIAVYYNITD